MNRGEELSSVEWPSDRTGHHLLYGALTRCGETRMTGALQVTGRPGGVFHFRHGLVVAVRTAGAPGPDTLLMRTGRVTSVGSADSVEAVSASRRIGSAELEVVRMVAIYDAAFAIISGQIDDCAVRVEDDPEQAGRGEDPERLMREAVRRVEALKRLPHVVLPHDDRMVIAPGTDRETAGTTHIRREILLLADGRRTCRDIAYTTAYGVYAITVEVSRMLEDRLLKRASSASAKPISDASADVAVGAARPILPRIPGPDRAVLDGPESLPRRLPGRSGIAASATETRTPKNWREFARFRDLAG